MSLLYLPICNKEHIWLPTPDPQTDLQLLFSPSQNMAPEHHFLKAGTFGDLEEGLKKRSSSAPWKPLSLPANAKCGCSCAHSHSCYCLTMVMNWMLAACSTLSHWHHHLISPPGSFSCCWKWRLLSAWFTSQQRSDSACLSLSLFLLPSLSPSLLSFFFCQLLNSSSHTIF